MAGMGALNRDDTDRRIAVDDAVLARLGEAAAAVIDAAIAQSAPGVQAQLAASTASGAFRLGVQVDTDPYEATIYLASRLDPDTPAVPLARLTPQIDAMLKEVLDR
jgi:hypothetical protein